MKHLIVGAGMLVALAGLAPSASAQWVVHDPTNYAQLVTTFRQAVQEYEFFLNQARRLPATLAARYRVPELPWYNHAIELAHAGALVAGLNSGEGVWAAYRGSVDPVDVAEDVLAQLPAALRPRLANRYGAIELADSIATLGIQQAGLTRAGGLSIGRAIQALEDDALTGPDEQHSQTALLNKINGASVVGLRIAERTTQFLAHTVEQLVVDNLRKREAEAQLMNAQLYHWRYGKEYGDSLFRHAAETLDSWRQP